MSGVGYNGRGAVTCHGSLVDGNSHPSLSKVIEVGCICNNAEINNSVVLVSRCLVLATMAVGQSPVMAVWWMGIVTRHCPKS